MTAKSIIFFLVSCVYMPCFAQNVVRNVQPTMFVHFQASINQGDSLVKYFFTSNHTTSASGKFAFVAELDLKNQYLTVDTIGDANYLGILGTGYELYALKISDSVLVVATNNFDCDVNYSELAYFDPSGRVKWKSGPYDEYFDYNNIRQMGMINPDVIAIVRMNEPTLFFDLYGEEIIPEFPPDIYFNILRIGDHWYGTRNQRLYKLDADFNVMDSYLSDSIRYIRQISNSRIIIGSNSGNEIVDTFFNEIAHTDIIGKSADASDTEVWIIGFEGLYLLDSTLEVIKLFPSIPLERMKTVDVFLDEAFVLSEYEGIQHKDFVIRKYSGKDTVIPVSLDLTIESIQLPDKIIRELWNGLSYAYTLYFDSISFTVRNNGNHPIESCNINYDWDTEVWCHGNYGEWQFDSLNIMPNETKLLTVYDYISGVIYYSVDNPLCFWVDHPNRTPDTDPANNSFCEYANIIISTEYVEEGGIKLFPNPASDYISITSEYQTGQTINITDVYGRQVLNTHIESPSTQINICGLVNGLYIVSVEKKLFRLMVIK